MFKKERLDLSNLEKKCDYATEICLLFLLLLIPRELAIPLISEASSPALGGIACKGSLKAIEADPTGDIVARLTHETVGTWQGMAFTVWRARSAVGRSSND